MGMHSFFNSRPGRPGFGPIWVCAALSILSAGSAAAQGQNQILGFGFFPSFWFPELQGTASTGVSPGEVVTLFTAPLGVPDAVATQIPLPNTLSGVSVLVRPVGANSTTGYPTSLPILAVHSVSATQLPTGGECAAVTGPAPVICSYSEITVEIPVESVCVINGLTPNQVCGETAPVQPPSMLLLNVTADGVTGPDFLAKVTLESHLLNSCDTIFGPSVGVCQPLVTHADGSFVTNQSPAHVGETIVLYAVGLENLYPDQGWPATGYAAAAPVEYPTGVGTAGLPWVTFVFLVSRNLGSPVMTGTTTTAQTTVVSSWAGLVPGYVGLYQTNVVVPSMPNTSYQCDATFPNQQGNVQIPQGDPLDAPLYICVQP